MKLKRRIMENFILWCMWLDVFNSDSDYSNSIALPIIVHIVVWLIRVFVLGILYIHNFVKTKRSIRQQRICNLTVNLKSVDNSIEKNLTRKFCARLANKQHILVP